MAEETRDEFPTMLMRLVSFGLACMLLLLMLLASLHNALLAVAVLEAVTVFVLVLALVMAVLLFEFELVSASCGLSTINELAISLLSFVLSFIGLLRAFFAFC